MSKRSNHNFQLLLLIVLIWFSLILTKTRENEIGLTAQKQPASFAEAVAVSTLDSAFSQTAAESSFENLFVAIPQTFLPKSALPLQTSFRSPSEPPEAAEQTVAVQKENSIGESKLPSSRIQSRAVLVSNLEAGSDLFVYNGKRRWPLASLTKLMTAVLAIEEIGKEKSVVVSRMAVMAEGDSGRIKSGEVYTVEELIKTMMICSSNDAAAVLAEFYAFGKENFTKRMNRKAQELEMEQTVFFDAAGLSPLNQSTAQDLKKLVRYISEKHPEIWDYSRETDFRNLRNINPFVGYDNFLGGKTGYLEEARQNLAALFSFGRQKFLIIVLGSGDRVGQAQMFLDYLSKI